MIEGYNNQVACVPPKLEAMERKLVGGIATSGHKNKLVGLEVVFGNAKIPAGSIVYVKAQLLINQKWKDEIYELNNTNVVLVPEDIVVLIGKK